MLKGVELYLPAPNEITNIGLNLSKNEEQINLEINNKKPFVGLAFKLEESKFG